jgi:enoyl-CoA hydratase/carnithine racemase
VLISGAGETFCTGGEVKGMDGRRSTKHLLHLPDSFR